MSCMCKSELNFVVKFSFLDNDSDKKLDIFQEGICFCKHKFSNNHFEFCLVTPLALSCLVKSRPSFIK